jgi:hypothetical protein
MSRAPSFACPRCGRVSHSPHDVREGYCGHCHDVTGPVERWVARQPDWWRCVSCGNSFQVPPGHQGPVLCPDHARPQVMVPGPGSPPCVVTEPFAVSFSPEGLAVPMALQQIAGLEVTVSGDVPEGAMVLVSRAMGLDPAQVTLGDFRRAAALAADAGAVMAQALEHMGAGFAQLGRAVNAAALSWASAGASPLADVREAMGRIAASGGPRAAPEGPGAEPGDDAMSWSYGMPEL